MRKILLLATSFLTCIGLLGQIPGAIIDVHHYEFSLDLNDSTKNIKGVATVEFQLLKDTRTVMFELVAKKADGKGMTVNAVTEKNEKLSFSQNNDMLSIDLYGKAGEKRTIKIDYEGIPADGLIIANNKYGKPGFFSDNWPNRAHNWIPCVDHLGDKASVDFIVTAPDHYKVVSNGVMVEEKALEADKKLTHYKETVPIPPDIMVIGVSDFAVQQAGTVQGIPVYSWVYPENKDKGFYDYAQALDILPFYIQNIGPYAFKKLANVQSKTIFGGMENAGAIFYAESSVTGTRTSESLLAHEIAHQWFGDMATETDWPHLWLSEGFATYMTILYFENKHGIDTARKMLIEDRKQVIAFSKTRLKPVVDSSTKDYMELLNPNSYQKGGWVLHMLRGMLGDSVFWKGLRTYYAAYAGKNASTDDFRVSMEKVSGRDLKLFFKQWLYSPGQPLLDIQWKYDNDLLTLTITQQPGQVFQFPLELAVYTGAQANALSVPVEVKEKQTSLTIHLTSKPSHIIADPNVKLLFDGSVKKAQ